MRDAGADLSRSAPASFVRVSAAKGRGEVMASRLQSDRGAIVILITHRMNMLTYCDDILVLNAGTVHTFGPKEHVLDRLSGYRPGKDEINAITSPPMMQAG